MGNGLATMCVRASVEVRARFAASLGCRYFLAGCLVFPAIFGAPGQARAQQASPGYDPRQTEKRFEDQQTDQSPGARPRLPRSPFGKPEGKAADRTPMFVLRHVVVTGAVAIPREKLATAYQPYLGKKVSQA